jgi:hypothetical protein
MISLWQAHFSFAMILFLVLPSFGLDRARQTALLTALLALSFLPLGGLSLAAHLRSYIDDLAITTMLLMGWSCLHRLGLLQNAQKGNTAVLILFAAMALVLYPATLGLTDLDPYRLGFSPRPMLVFVALLTFGLLYLRNWLAVVMLAGATLAFVAGIKPSHNYWDYLVDPLLGLYCCLALLTLACRRLFMLRGPNRNDAV